MFGWITKLTDSVKVFLTNKYISSFIRTASAAIGGYLYGTVGVPQEVATEFSTSTEKLFAALVTIALTQLFSWVDKARNQK